MRKLRPFVLGTLGCALLVVVLGAGSVGNLFAEVTKVLPVFVTNTPDRQPFQAQVGLAFTLAPSYVAGATLDVPAGKRLVIEYVSASFSMATGEKPVLFSVETNQGGSPLYVPHYFVTTFQGHRGDLVTGIDFFTAGEDTRLYSNAGTDSVFIQVQRDVNGSTASTVNVGISGYLVDAP